MWPAGTPVWTGVLYPAPNPRHFDPIRCVWARAEVDPPNVELRLRARTRAQLYGLVSQGRGRDARYDYLYTPQELEPWVARTEEIARDKTTENVDVVFNNHYKAQAVVNAVQFKALMTDKPATVPPILYESYPDALAPFAFPEDPRNVAA